MIYLALLVLVVATWALIHFAAACQQTLLAKRVGRPSGGVSILPGMVLMPALFLGVAWLMDQCYSNAGTVLIGAAHVVLLVVASVSVASSSDKARHSKNTEHSDNTEQ